MLGWKLHLVRRAPLLYAPDTVVVWLALVYKRWFKWSNVWQIWTQERREEVDLTERNKNIAARELRSES